MCAGADYINVILHRIFDTKKMRASLWFKFETKKEHDEMPRLPIRWLLVEWSDGTLGVVSVKAVINVKMKKDLTTGKLITVSQENEEVQAKIVMSSDDRGFLEQQMQAMSLHKAEDPQLVSQQIYPQLYEEIDPNADDPAASHSGDYSASASSWMADNWSSEASDDEKLVIKKIKKEKFKRKYTRNRQGKPQVPTLRVEPIIPTRWRLNESANLSNRSIIQSANEVTTVQTITSQLNITDTFRQTPRRRVMMYDQQVQTDNLNLPTREEIKKLQQEIAACQELITNSKQALAKMSPMFNMINLLNALTGESSTNVDPANVCPRKNEVIPNFQAHKNTDGPSVPIIKPTFHESTNEMNPSVSWNKANVAVEQQNNVSIGPELRKETIKKTRPKRVSKIVSTSPSFSDSDEIMVPIGSGKTVVPKSIYDEINWTSYSMATRKLLMAVFPRKVLATHSLTGKSSPAFMNKPAKLCLDPRKVSDIIMTVTKNCNVKENLVRNAITIKCTDENKMYKFHANKGNSSRIRKMTAAEKRRDCSDEEYQEQ